MAVVKNLMVRAGADFSAITHQANKAKASMSGMETSVSKSCTKMTASVRSMRKVFATIGATISVAAITAFSKEAKAAYDEQIEASAKLAQVMRNTMGARAEEVKSVEDLIDAQERLGVVDGAVQTEAAQELATYLTLSGSLKKLIPVMNDMVAQQYGIGASAESAVSIATMMGKVMNGQTSALSRYGYSFTTAQEAILKFGTEEQRAATLAQVVEESVGGMNAALAATPNGRLEQVRFTIGKIQENFGQAVSSISTTFLPALNGICSVLASMATLANKVAQAIANVFGGGASAAATAVSYTAGASSAMEDLTDATTAAGDAAKKLGTYGFDTLQKMGGTTSSKSSGGTADEGGSSGGGVITESTEGAGEAAESIGWLEKGLARLKQTADTIDFSKVSDALDRLKTSAQPLTSGLFSGLKWGYDNVLEPLAQWSIEDAIPSFLDTLGTSAQACAGPLKRLGTAVKPLVSTAFSGLKWAYDNVFIPFAGWAGGSLAPSFLDTLAAGADVLSAAISALQPMGAWLWDNFLQPLASWTGGAIVTVLEGITKALEGVSGWISANQGPVQVMTGIVAAFFAAWALTSVAEFLVCAGGLPGVLASVTAALKGCTVAKIADKAETLAICALYAKDWAVALANNVMAIGRDVAAWIALRAEWIAGKVALVASTAAQVAHTAASWAGTAATTAFGVAMQVLTSPITLVIAAIAALVAGIVLLVQNWDTVKAVGAAAWEGIKGAWSAASSWFSENVSGPISTAWGTATTNLKEWGSNAWTNIKGAWSAASSWFTTNVTTPISNGFKGFANGIIGFFEGLVNGAISGINTIINGFNRISFSIPDWVPVIGGNSWGFNLATVSPIALPRLAEGAVLPGGHPFAAIVNDQKHGVNVETPLATMIEAMMTALRATDFGNDIQVNVRAVFDGQLAALARLLRPYFEADAQRVGQQASTAKGVV